jgi:hypothetical protein
MTIIERVNWIWIVLAINTGMLVALIVIEFIKETRRK